MPTLQRRQLVGHDILLARHGTHIRSMRVDRRAGCVVAILDDGSRDSAPNTISPGLRMPETMRSVLREDWKFLAAVTACCTGLAGAMFAAALGGIAAMGSDPALIQLMTTFAAYGSN
jgi:hypothetical protein